VVLETLVDAELEQSLANVPIQSQATDFKKKSSTFARSCSDWYDVGRADSDHSSAPRADAMSRRISHRPPVVEGTLDQRSRRKQGWCVPGHQALVSWSVREVQQNTSAGSTNYWERW
jgi:hypothetical protein